MTKKLFLLAAVGLILFEVLNVYFIMPMPGSQRMRSIDLAYFLYTWRWVFRVFFGLILVATFFTALKSWKWVTIIALVLVAGVTYAFNFVMAADAMFYQPEDFRILNAKESKVEKDRLVIGVEHNGEAKAYPISLIGYHHQVLDTLGGKPIMVTYCTVCRTGRVFEPLVNGKPEKFRLVGMDHFNAMFEDETTKSWWRQANGEAITGKLKGQTLPEMLSQQTTVEQWLKLYPESKIMQPDPTFKEKYDSTAKYEKGKSKSDLTRTDSLSWKDKSWVVGIETGNGSKAFDWIRLQKERVVNAEVGDKSVVLVLGKDNKSFFAFERPDKSAVFTVKQDTLLLKDLKYDFNGKSTDSKSGSLKKIKAYQEFWHSWKTFHPATEKY